MRKGRNLKRKRTQILSTNNVPDTHRGLPSILSYVILIILLTHRVVMIFVVQMKHLGMKDFK